MQNFEINPQKETQLTFFLSENHLICFDELKNRISFNLSLSRLHSDAIGCQTLTSHANDWLIVGCQDFEKDWAVESRTNIFMLEVEKIGVSTVRRAFQKMSLELNEIR